MLDHPAPVATPKPTKTTKPERALKTPTRAVERRMITLARRGKSLPQIADALGVSRPLFHKWGKMHPGFEVTRRRAMAISALARALEKL